MKEKFLRSQLANPHGDTSLIPAGTFGSSGHDLDAGRKALRAPATLAPAPTLKVGTRCVHVSQAHQVWRYGIANSGSTELGAWLDQVANWLEAQR